MYKKKFLNLDVNKMYYLCVIYVKYTVCIGTIKDNKKLNVFMVTMQKKYKI